MDSFQSLIYLVLYVVLLGPGLFAIVGALTGGDWYFESEQVKPMVSRIGKPYAQLVHLLIGLGMTGGSSYLLWDWFKG